MLDEDNDLIMGNFYEPTDSLDENDNFRRLKSVQSRDFNEFDDEY
jgi:hypothetical protein